uniref:Uncharacterized protein n=1 Tax=Anguilla anguilla TaxID=7936 RepID=A0A0E9RLH0_ANGAN
MFCTLILILLDSSTCLLL